MRWTKRGRLPGHRKGSALSDCVCDCDTSIDRPNILRLQLLYEEDLRVFTRFVSVEAFKDANDEVNSLDAREKKVELCCVVYVILLDLILYVLLQMHLFYPLRIY